MHIEQLEYIVEIAKSGSLSAAAQQLHITQSALSQSVAKLEEELGIPLFHRTHTGAKVTEHGRKVVHKALEALHAINEMKEYAEFEQSMFSGELTISVFPGLMPILVQALSTIKKEYPRLRIHIDEQVSEAIIQDVRSNRIGLGLAVMYAEEVEQAAGLVFEPMVDSKLVVCAHKQSPAAQSRTIHPRELTNYEFVLFRDRFVEDMVSRYSAEWGKLSTLFTTNNAESIYTALKENMGLTIGHDFSFLGQYERIPEPLTLVEIEPFVQRPMKVGWIRSEKHPVAQLHRLCIHRFKYALDMTRI